PDHAAALNGLGMIALAKDPAGAIDLFTRAAAADPDAPALRMNLATAARAVGDDALEQSALLAALACDQRHLMALIRLAELHERRSEDADAAARWSAVLAVGHMQPDRSAALDPILKKAAAFVAARTQHLAESVAAALARDHDLAARRRVATGIDAMLGGRRIYANACSGLHIPFLPADEFFARDLFPWLAEIEARTPAIRAEFLRVYAQQVTDAEFQPYVDMPPGTPANRWSPLDRSADWSALHLYRHGVRDEAVCARCPETAAALAGLPLPELPARAPTALFSVLRPHTRIPPHTGVSNMRATVHLPLVVPPGCGFRVGGETREWQVGRAFVFDDTIEHEAWNASDAVRAILIFDAWNPYLRCDERAMIATFFETTDRSRGHGFNTDFGQ
ncbi:MAG: aspartyl/asparaginyl beta-hydroxylase domain-containing protein, partial [Sphingomonas sp.]